MDFEKLYIDGAWVPSASDKWIEVENPASRSVIARVPAGNAEDVDRAAKAASAAFPAWRDTPLADRIALMEKFLTEFRAREEDLVRITVEELEPGWVYALKPGRVPVHKNPFLYRSRSYGAAR